MSDSPRSQNPSEHPQGPGTLEIPALHLPCAAQLNPAYGTAYQHARDWASRFGLIASEADDRRIDLGEYALLCGYFYPEATQEHLDLVTEWVMWEFALDDTFSDSYQSARDWREVRSAVSRLTAFLSADATQDVPEAISPAESALVNLRERTMFRMTPSWGQRFFNSVRQFAEGYIWEARNLSRRQVPDLTDHILNRRYTGGTPPMLDLIELTMGFEIPRELVKTRAVSVAAMAVVDHMMHVNDVFSFRKERAHDDIHNNVYIFQSLMGCPVDSAVRFVTAMAQSQVSLLQRMIDDEIPMMLDDHDADPQTRDGIARWAEVLMLWLPGNLEWHRASGRYREIELWRPTHKARKFVQAL
jgi:germacradienol/geosmin synthase